MFLVLFLCAVMWGIGWVMGAPKSQRAIMVGVLLAGVILIQLVLPDGHPLREATGSSPGLWLLLALSDLQKVGRVDASSNMKLLFLTKWILEGSEGSNNA